MLHENYKRDRGPPRMMRTLEDLAFRSRMPIEAVEEIMDEWIAAGLEEEVLPGFFRLTPKGNMVAAALVRDAARAARL